MLKCIFGGVNFIVGGFEACVGTIPDEQYSKSAQTKFQKLDEINNLFEICKNEK